MSTFILATEVQNLLWKMPINIVLAIFVNFHYFWHNITYDVTATTYMEYWYFIWYGWMNEGCLIANFQVIVTPTW